MRRALVVLILCMLCRAAFAKGATVDLSFKQAPLHDLLRVLSDVGRVTIVPLGVPETKIEAVYKRVPWDTVLADLVKRAKLASVREGTVILVGDPATIAARKQAKRPAYKQARVNLDLHDASGAAIAALITKLGYPVTLTGGTAVSRQKLSNIPLDQAVDVIALATGATAAPGTPPPSQKGCQAPDRPSKGLRPAGIGAIGGKRYAVLVDGPSVVLVAMGDCLGSDRVTVRDVGNAYVTVKIGDDETTSYLHPSSNPDASRMIRVP